ncbi:MAG: hypothetical protein HYR55_11045 [Acidobacteria bacterium]|nr:hypothetical protein [Acidobacteriota bacterium]MBI3657714.1 hypothetical protein [Acidobacteriota bacterium]
METKVISSLLDDGHLSLSAEVKEKLQLGVGDKVELVIKPLKEIPDEENPLLKLIGLCDSGPPDGSAEHDRDLYLKEKELKK